MRTKSIKVSLIALLIVLFTAFTAMFITGFANTAKADTVVFEFETGAYVRRTGDGGLRFRLKMDEATATEIVGNEKETLYFYVASSTRMSSVTTGAGAKALNTAGNAWEVRVDKDKIYAGKTNLGVPDGFYYANALINVNNLGKTSSAEIAYRTTDFVAAAAIYNSDSKTYTSFVKSVERSLRNTASYAALRGGLYSNIKTVYSWLGSSSDYSVYASTSSDYNALVNILEKDNSLYFYLDDVIDSADLLDNENYSNGAISQYTVIWKNDDGTTLETDSSVNYGTTPSYDGETPTKASTAQYTYTFDGWSPAVSTVTGDITYTATYSTTVNKYTVIWKNDDGTTLETDSNVVYGTTPSYDGETPTKAADAQYTYEFDSWSPAVSTVTGDITYTAQYSSTVNKYTVTIGVNIESFGTVNTTSVANVPYGTVITTSSNTINVNGTTVTATATTATAQYTYTFTGWTNGTATVEGATSVTANFTRTVNNYTVNIYKNNNDYGTISATSLTVPYGSSISFSDNTLTVGGQTVTATPNFGYKIEDISITDGVDGATTGTSTTITINFAVATTGTFYDSTATTGISGRWGNGGETTYSADNSEQQYNDKNSLKIVESATEDGNIYYGFGVIFDDTKLNTLLSLGTYGVKLTFHYRFTRGSLGRGSWISFGGTYANEITSFSTWNSASFILSSAPANFILGVYYDASLSWVGGWSNVNGTLYVSDITYELMNESGTLVDFGAGDNNVYTSWIANEGYSITEDVKYDNKNTLKIVDTGEGAYQNAFGVYLDKSFISSVIEAGKQITLNITYQYHPGTGGSYVSLDYANTVLIPSADTWYTASFTFSSVPANFIACICSQASPHWEAWSTTNGIFYIANITYTIS